MNCKKRALRYILRKKVKTMILFLVLLLVETMILSTVIILRASTEEKKSLQERTNTKVIAEIQDEKQFITETELKQMKDMENVKELNSSLKVTAYPYDFQLISYSENNSEKNIQLQLTAYDDLSADGPFADSQVRLVDGEYPQKQNEIVINKVLANYNSLTVGSSLTIESKEGTEITAIVSGIYSSGLEEKQGEETLAVYRIENTIYISSEFALDFQSDQGYESVVVYLNDPEQMDETAEKLAALLNDKVTITKSDTLFQQMKAPLEQVERVVKLMLILTIGTSVIVIALLLCMWMRARKKEIAVYISLGEPKGSIFLQVCLESLMVFLTATSSSVFTGGVVAWFLNLILFNQDAENSITLQIGIQGSDVGYLLALGIGILIAAVGISLFPILQMNPKDILSKMEG